MRCWKVLTHGCANGVKGIHVTLMCGHFGATGDKRKPG